MKRMLTLAALTALAALPAGAQPVSPEEGEAIALDHSSDCYEFGPGNNRQHFFLRRDTEILLEVIGGGGGGGGNTMSAGGGGGEAGEYRFKKSEALTKGLYFVRVGSGGAGGRGKRPPADDAGDHASAGTTSQVRELGGSFNLQAAGGQGGQTNGSRSDGRPSPRGTDGVNVANGATLISTGGQGGSADRNGAPGESPGAGGGGTGAFRAGGGLVGGRGGDGRVILCVYEPGALASIAGGTAIQ